jgi:NTE family protein
VCGTSSGAINATAIAAGAKNFSGATKRLCELWSTVQASDIYQTDAWQLMGQGGRWLVSFVPAWRHRRPASLLDNAPLAGFLSRNIPFGAVQSSLDAGVLDSLAVTAMSYRSGMSVTFCQARPGLQLWERSQRLGIPETIDVRHLLASSAIPFVFPPAPIDGEYFGDGAVRQVAPTGPALHLGADRILVIGAARSTVNHNSPISPTPPSMAQIGGQVLASIFTDALGTDLEKVRLVNVAVRQIPSERLTSSPVPLRDVELSVLTPSIALEDIALAHSGDLPKSMRVLLRGVGATRPGGGALLSYLLFAPGFCQALLDLGRADAVAHRAEIEALLAGVF